MIKHPISFLLLLALPTVAMGAVSDLDKAVLTPTTKNLLQNGGGEAGVARWSSSGVAPTPITAATNIRSGKGSISWDSTAASQYVIPEGAGIVLPASGGLVGAPLVAQCFVKVASGTSTHLFQVRDGSGNIITSVAVPTSTSTFLSVTSAVFTGTASTTYLPRIMSVASNEPQIYIDDCTFQAAEGFNLFDAPSPYGAFVGGVGFVPTASCAWAITQADPNTAPYAADSDCSAATVYGSATSPGKVPKASFAQLDAGDYIAVAQFEAAPSADTVTALGIWDETGSAVSSEYYGGYTLTAFATPYTIVAQFRLTGAMAKAFDIRGASGSGSMSIFADGSSGQTFSLKVYRLSSPSQQGVRAETVNWKVDATIAGASPSLGLSSTSSAYVPIEDAGMALTNITAPGNLPAQIGCSSTNAPTGTTCAAGNESTAVSWVLPKAQKVHACVTFPHYPEVAAGAGVGAVVSKFAIVETATNAQTILQQGPHVESGIRFTQHVGSGTGSYKTVRFCSDFNFESSGQKMLRLFYEQSAASSGNQNLIVATEAPIHWEISPVTEQVPSPIFVGSVTTSGSERIERARISGAATDQTNATSGDTVIFRQSGSWLTSVTWSSTGTYALVWTPFSAIPSCNANNTANGATIGTCTVTSITTSGATVSCGRVDTIAAINSWFDVICIGQR